MALSWPAAGWVRFPWDPAQFAWTQAALEPARRALADPTLREAWLRCEGTWFVGVDALPTAGDGSMDGYPLAGPAARALGPFTCLHRAQLSVTFPGYPRPREGESKAAFRYRVKRDAAHVDGFHAVGPERRRFLREKHDWILGLPLTETSPGASPLVVWEGSHHIIRAALRQALSKRPESDWPHIDVTEAYWQARREVFDTCRRVAVHARPGEAVLMHRFLLHGVAPWQPAALASQDGRMIAYFRPETADSGHDWLSHD